MNRPILLDTCAAIYVMEKAPMRQAAVNAIDEAYDRGEKVFVSPIIAWEAGMLAAKGRFRSRYSAQRWWALLVEQPHIALAELPAHVLLESSFLPGQIHRDPMDRAIAATAREYGFTVMTRDRALLDYAAQGHLSALAC
jgi:PIN domain nuclease of toxin-antitoxin system